MDPRAYHIAQEFVRGHIRRARYAPEFLKAVEGRKFRNPETDNEVQFESLPDEEQARIYAQWSKNVQQEGKTPDRAQQPQVQSREQITAQNLDIAKHGKIKEKKVLSAGGRDSKGPVNQSYIVQLEHEGKTQNFIYKPAEGEEPHLRFGVPAGQYHAREAAAYSIDRMMGGRGVVPVTHTRGKDDGSYQLWAEGARAMHGKDMDHLVKTVPLDEVHRSPDFQRMNVMDLMLGHQDRHRGNILYSFDGEEKPENLRFVGIDNGLSLSSPQERQDHAIYVNPFAGWYEEPEGADKMDMFERAQASEDAARKAKKEGDRAVAKSLSNLSPETVESIKKIDLDEMAKALTDSGIDEEGAVRAALTRVAALQADPTIFKEILDSNSGNLEESWTEFQYQSGQEEKLLRRAGAKSDLKERVQQAVEKAKPQKGWSKPITFAETNKALMELAGWGKEAPPDQATAPDRGGGGEKPPPAGTVKLDPKKPKRLPTPPKKEQTLEMIDWSKLAHQVRNRWLRGKTQGKKLTVSQVNPVDHSHTVVGEFELDKNGKVHETYKDYRFRNDIHSGIRLMGKRITPKDGALFMGALEKVYGARSMFNVKRT